MALPGPQLGGISLMYHLAVNAYYGAKKALEKFFKRRAEKAAAIARR